MAYTEGDLVSSMQQAQADPNAWRQRIVSDMQRAANMQGSVDRVPRSQAPFAQQWMSGAEPQEVDMSIPAQDAVRGNQMGRSFGGVSIDSSIPYKQRAGLAQAYLNQRRESRPELSPERRQQMDDAVMANRARQRDRKAQQRANYQPKPSLNERYAAIRQMNAPQGGYGGRGDAAAYAAQMRAILGQAELAQGQQQFGREFNFDVAQANLGQLNAERDRELETAKQKQSSAMGMVEFLTASGTPVEDLPPLLVRAAMGDSGPDVEAAAEEREAALAEEEANNRTWGDTLRPLATLPANLITSALTAGLRNQSRRHQLINDYSQGGNGESVLQTGPSQGQQLPMPSPGLPQDQMPNAQQMQQLQQLIQQLNSGSQQG